MSIDCPLASAEIIEFPQVRLDINTVLRIAIECMADKDYDAFLVRLDTLIDRTSAAVIIRDEEECFLSRSSRNNLAK